MNGQQCILIEMSILRVPGALLTCGLYDPSDIILMVYFCPPNQGAVKKGAFRRCLFVFMCSV
jgi:hypothetical protein